MTSSYPFTHSPEPPSYSGKDYTRLQVSARQSCELRLGSACPAFEERPRRHSLPKASSPLVLHRAESSGVAPIWKRTGLTGALLLDLLGSQTDGGEDFHHDFDEYFRHGSRRGHFGIDFEAA